LHTFTRTNLLQINSYGTDFLCSTGVGADTKGSDAPLPSRVILDAEKVKPVYMVVKTACVVGCKPVCTEYHISIFPKQRIKIYTLLQAFMI